MTYPSGRLAVLLLVLAAGALSAQEQAPTARPFAVTARRYRFDPPRIEVFQDDLVRIELKTADIPHSMTMDAYRIAKKVAPGKPVTFEFRADRAGTFPFYCNLQAEDGCRQMRGEFVVKPRR
jgi:cytochrome c oxidase subunit II